MNAQEAVKTAAKLVQGQERLGELIGVSQSQVSQWMTGRRPVPPRRAVAIELATGGVVSRQMLRPDDWQQLWPEWRGTRKKGVIAR